MIRRIFKWFDERLGAASFARRSLNKVFPDHWSFMLGEIALYCFIILVVTGVFLTFFYVPDQKEIVYHGHYAPLAGQEVSRAYGSVLRLSFDVRSGLVFRQIHHWAALIMVGAVATHMARVFFTGAFRKPREINWILGVTLLALTLAIGFCGYSLPDDLLSGTGIRIAYSIVLSIPVIGVWFAYLLFGGEYPAPGVRRGSHHVHDHTHGGGRERRDRLVLRRVRGDHDTRAADRRHRAPRRRLRRHVLPRERAETE